MGRSITPKYSLVVDPGNVPGKPATRITSMCWFVNRDGAPTAANLEKWVRGYMRSLEPGGSNAHISKSLGYVPYPNYARITINGDPGTVVAEWKAPAFMVIGS